ncbi:MAG: sel1 repeat family protein [Erysipelotrichaceae bacterium]|nr:sel1 repeat family protein [Erysipelotrichaceae bacterium]
MILSEDYLTIARQLINDGCLVEASSYLAQLDNGMADYLLATIIDLLPEEIRRKFEVRTYFELLLRSSIRGCPEAMKPLADCYRRDAQFRNRDDAKAFMWYKKAYEAGNMEALPSLIECYRSGIGTEQNFEEVVKLKKHLREYERNNLIFKV